MQIVFLRISANVIVLCLSISLVFFRRSSLSANVILGDLILICTDVLYRGSLNCPSLHSLKTSRGTCQTSKETSNLPWKMCKLDLPYEITQKHALALAFAQFSIFLVKCAVFTRKSVGFSKCLCGIY